ncbi:diketogulonate reductase-like aldo/keto reductase [Paenibacillus anaericanus]|nr:diketogulonate reductase-like aldo/keto reductase [Paenibacillus anaericanus]
MALNWALRQQGLVTIPKAANKEHIVDNLNALGWELEKDDIDQIESQGRTRNEFTRKLSEVDLKSFN